MALCAARSIPELGDIYLSGEAHHALMDKISADLNEEHAWGAKLLIDERHASLRAVAESNNPNRTSWDELYGKKKEVITVAKKTICPTCHQDMNDPPKRGVHGKN